MSLFAEQIAAQFPGVKLRPVVGYLYKEVEAKNAFTSSAPTHKDDLLRVRAMRKSKLVDRLMESDKHGLAVIKSAGDAEVFIEHMRKEGMLCNADPVKDAKGETQKHDGRRVFFPRRPGTKGSAGESTEYMLWKYEHATAWRHVQLVLVVLAVICCQMYQLWPDWARSIIWYISVSMLLFILGVCVLQLVLFVVVWPSGWDFWLLPNFTSEEAPIWMLFSPLYTLDRNPGGHPALRVGIVALLGAAIFTLSRMPQSEFQEFVSSQKKIVDDLYSGALLGDGKEGSAGLVAGGKFDNPMNPFGNKWGPGSGRYGTMRPAHIPSIEEARFPPLRSFFSRALRSPLPHL